MNGTKKNFRIVQSSVKHYKPMNKKEATQIVSDTLQSRGNAEIKVHEIIYHTREYISATASYVWYLNGYRKEVRKASVILCKIENQNWKQL